MSYIGNQIIPVPFVVDLFSGTGSATSFGPLVRAPAGTASIAVFISGVYKVPGVDYTVSGDTITFTVAPASGTNNIVVHHLGNGFMATQVPGDGTVSGNKIQSDAIRSNNIVAGQITGNLIATSSISGNQIGAYAVSGNQIGIGAVSANNFAGGGITSNVLSSNLSISVSRVSETINFNSTPIGSNTQARANVNLDVLNTTVYYFSSNTSGNVTLNLRGNTNNTFDSAVEVGNTVSVVVTLRHNTAAHRSGVNVAIDGGYISTTRANPDSGNILFYVANTTANHSPIGTLESNVIGLTVVKKGANSYIVYFSNTLYGLT